MTTKSPVDVLAALDRITHVVLPIKLWDGNNPYCGSAGRESSEYQADLVALCEARAAVAELVAAIGPVMEWAEQIEDEDSRHPRQNLRAVYAALAKFA